LYRACYFYAVEAVICYRCRSFTDIWANWSGTSTVPSVSVTHFQFWHFFLRLLFEGRCMFANSRQSRRTFENG